MFIDYTTHIDIGTGTGTSHTHTHRTRYDTSKIHTKIDFSDPVDIERNGHIRRFSYVGFNERACAYVLGLAAIGMYREALG